MISAYWINPEEIASVASAQTITNDYWFREMYSVGATGYQSTYSARGVLWNIPNDLIPPPVRLIQRNDGLGVEQHPRIDSMRANNWSSANRSIRIFNQGDGTYR